MVIFLYIVHVLAALSLMVVILLQSGKGGGLGSGFGGAAASATKIFGGGGTANVLGRSTVIIASVFMATSLSLAYFSSHEDSVMDLNTKTDASISSQEDQIIEEGGTGQSSPALQQIDKEDSPPPSDDADPNKPAPAQDGAAPPAADTPESAAQEAEQQEQDEQDTADAPRGPGNPEGAPDSNE